MSTTGVNMVKSTPHSYACEGLPGRKPCPRSRKGDKDGVCYNHNMMNVCPDCSKAHDDVRDGIDPSAALQHPTNVNVVTRSMGNQASPSQSDSAAGNSKIFDPVLFYVATSRDTSRRSDVAHLVATYFSDELVNNAKTLLWRTSSSDVIGEVVRRKSTDERTRKEANAQDIYDAMKKLEDKKCLPIFALESSQYHLIPKVQPCELLEYSVTERMAQFECKLERMSESMDLLSNQNAMMRDELSAVSSRPRPDAPEIQIIHVDSPRNPASAPSRDKPSYSGTAKANLTRTSAKASKLLDPSEVLDPRKELKNLLQSQGGIRLGSVTSLMSDDSTTAMADADGFQLPKEQRKRMQRSDDKALHKRRRPQNVIRGKGADFKSLKGSEPDREIYVYRLEMTTSEDDMKEFLTSHNISIRKILEVTDPKWNTKSFRVGVPASQLELALGLDWPESVCVRRWWYIPQKKDTE